MVSVPVAWYPRIFNATPEQRDRWGSCTADCGIRWPRINEDLSIEGLPRGDPAPLAKIAPHNTADSRRAASTPTADPVSSDDASDAKNPANMPMASSCRAAIS
jgi:hypothetical protein